MAAGDKVIDLTTVKYYVSAILSDGRLVHLENVAENIAWEDNESELSVRLNLTLRDIEFEGSRLSKILSLCSIVYLHAEWNGGNRTEIFRGTIWEWEHSRIDGDPIIVTGYDMLYYLQKTTDSAYWAKGKTTEEICSDVLANWEIPLGGYTGPEYTHEKTLYKNKTIASMLTETLEEARKKTGVKSVIRASEGDCYILERGSNEDIWNFEAGKNLVSIKDKYSMVNLVTRVVIVGKDDKKGRPKVEATLDGATEYGILQTVKTVGSTSLDDAKDEAQELLDEKGSPERKTTITAPDVPTVRKGDLIHISADSMNGYFYVLGVAHNATAATMQMEVEPYE